MLLFLSACQNQDVVAKRGEYFDMIDFIDEQAHLLTMKSVKLEKSASIDHEKGNTQVEMDSAAWIRELEIFKEADINQARFSKAYHVKDKEQDTKSNLQILNHTAVNPEKMKVAYLKVYYLNDLNQIRKIEAQLNEKNLLYTSSKTLKMDLENVSGKVLLKAYSIEGFQKVVMKDTIKFKVENRLSY